MINSFYTYPTYPWEQDRVSPLLSLVGQFYFRFKDSGTMSVLQAQEAAWAEARTLYEVGLKHEKFLEEWNTAIRMNNDFDARKKYAEAERIRVAAHDEQFRQDFRQHMFEAFQVGVHDPNLSKEALLGLATVMEYARTLFNYVRVYPTKGDTHWRGKVEKRYREVMGIPEPKKEKRK